MKFTSITFILTALLSSTFTAMAQTVHLKADLFDQEKVAQTAINELLLKRTYKQVCLEQAKVLAPLYTNKNRLKGDISRIYFFCESEYNQNLSHRQRRSFEIWDIKDRSSV